MLPAGAAYIIEKLESAGFEAYAVGGCVRDILLGKVPHDFDITTSAEPYEIKSAFDHTVDTGIEHGTVTVLLPDGAYEVTTYRIDGKYSDGRHPEGVTFTKSLEEDLKRRDFTINAMAYHPTKGVVDLLSGKEDLKAGIIRCVGDPHQRFSEDALRMMRAIRFSAQLSFSLEEGTRQAICDLAPTLSKISAERIREELCKLLVSDNPGHMLLFYETGLTRVFLPEFDEIMACEQHTPHHMYTVGVHSVKAMEQVEPELVLRLSMLLHDIGKPALKTTDAKGVDHFKRHAAESERLAREIMHRLRFDNDSIYKVSKLVKYHDDRPANTLKSIRKAISHIGEDAFPNLFKVQWADCLAQSEYQRAEKLKRIEDFKALYEQILSANNALKVADLAISGKALIDELSMSRGRQIGEMLNYLLEQCLEDPGLNTRDKLLELAKARLEEYE